VTSFDALLAEGEAVPVDGWDFSWFEGRATEERPAWGYASLLPSRIAAATAVLDVQTGGGEVLAEALAAAPRKPLTVTATEAWPPNVALARAALAGFGAVVEETDGLPFPDESFDLVISRHPVDTDWPEIARILKPGGMYLSQQVGTGTMHELTDAMMGPQPVGDSRDPARHAEWAKAAGLTVVDLRSAALRTEFLDVAAVVVYLRKVVWIVPGFTVAAYRDRLRSLPIPFVAWSRRFLIEARKPESRDEEQ